MEGSESCIESPKRNFEQNETGPTDYTNRLRYFTGRISTEVYHSKRIHGTEIT